MTAAADGPTYVACLTPPGASAIATLGLRGPRAWSVARELFQPPPSRQPLPAEPEAGRFWLGRLGDESRGGADEVVLAVKQAAPVPWLEIHCHGGREVIRLLEETLAARGVQICSWQELERRTASDPLQAAALAALAEASTVRTAAILLDQFDGAFARALEAASVALQHDDPAAAARCLDELARHASLGRHLTVPWRVVVAGAPNVGKSSLVNALAGYPRSVVDPTPGTTRDVVTTRIAIDGWPVELADTAGWRDAAESLEQQGIDRAREAATAADLSLWLLDAAADPVWPSETTGSIQLVINKIDQPPAWDITTAAGAVRVSALTGAGLDELQQRLSHRLIEEPPPPGAPVPFTAALVESVLQARQAWQEGKTREALELVETMRTERR
jgi:tRNA modification GTPase